MIYTHIGGGGGAFIQNLHVAKHIEPRQTATIWRGWGGGGGWPEGGNRRPLEYSSDELTKQTCQASNTNMRMDTHGHHRDSLKIV